MINIFKCLLSLIVVFFSTTSLSAVLCEKSSFAQGQFQLCVKEISSGPDKFSVTVDDVSVFDEKVREGKPFTISSSIYGQSFDGECMPLQKPWHSRTGHMLIVDVAMKCSLKRNSKLVTSLELKLVDL